LVPKIRNEFEVGGMGSQLSLMFASMVQDIRECAI